METEYLKSYKLSGKPQSSERARTSTVKQKEITVLHYTGKNIQKKKFNVMPERVKI